MQLTFWDGVAFFSFLAAVVGISLYASRKEDTSEDYFLAGRNLTWWLIGFSLIASNISTEHFIGMAGSGFGAAGLAIASYEWIAAISLVIVAFWLLPLFLRLGIFTMPEFLEHRYGNPARTIMALYLMAAYVGVAIAGVLYSGALGLETIFGLDMVAGIWLIGALAGAYTVYGGLKAVVWSDLLQGSALLIGGLVVTGLGLSRVGGLGAFLETNADKLHTVLPADDPELPWTIFLLGIWIPNIFYWGFNQFITQRTLGARSLAAGQRGVVFAAALKLLIPFIVVFPGIIAYQMYGEALADGDQAYPLLIRDLLPAGLRGVMFAALFGAIMSSLDSMLNSASTLFTMDVYKRHFRPEADARRVVRVGRISTAFFVIVGCLLAPLPGRFEGVYAYMQLVWGFISPAITAVFLFGLVVPSAPLSAAVAGLLVGPITYGLLNAALPQVAFLNHMAFTFLTVVAVMTGFTLARPLTTPVTYEAKSDIDLTPSRGARIGGVVVVLATVALYLTFW
ncbi:MAG: sodium transporter [Gemmatimonas sp. SG8_23]|jgi:SSS family solute:Na+ symporter|nr:MAG: sodium transporter [Gemmatimonas sp. SG8_23]